jgi:hypothetical protein
MNDDTPLEVYDMALLTNKNIRLVARYRTKTNGAWYALVRLTHPSTGRQSYGCLYRMFTSPDRCFYMRPSKWSHIMPPNALTYWVDGIIHW